MTPMSPADWVEYLARLMERYRKRGGRQGKDNVNVVG